MEIPGIKFFFTETAACDWHCGGRSDPIYSKQLESPNLVTNAENNAPSAISAIDPSRDQIAFAKTKPSSSRIDYREGDAMSLPFSADEFDVAIMALVMQHLPDSSKALSEIIRVVRKGGAVAAYVWPGRTEGHPYQPMSEAMRSIGVADASRPGTRMRTSEALADLFNSSGLDWVECDSIDFTLEFDDFSEFWSAHNPENYGHLSSSAVDRLKSVLQERFASNVEGRISFGARAFAIRGRVAE